jgi:hypothetical protein
MFEEIEKLRGVVLAGILAMSCIALHVTTSALHATEDASLVAFEPDSPACAACVKGLHKSSMIPGLDRGVAVHRLWIERVRHEQVESGEMSATLRGIEKAVADGRMLSDDGALLARWAIRQLERLAFASNTNSAACSQIRLELRRLAASHSDEAVVTAALRTLDAIEKTVSTQSALQRVVL